jgi:hypothetical protein
MLPRLQASRIGRSCSARFQAFPSSLLNSASPLARPSNESGEQLGRLAGEGNVACLPALALADRERPHIGIEVGNFQAAELTIAAAGQEGGVDKVSELTFAGMEQPCDLVLRQIAVTGASTALNDLTRRHASSLGTAPLRQA